SRVEFESGIQRKPQEVVQFRGQIRKLEFRGEHGLLTFKHVRATLGRRYSESSAAAYVFLILPQMLQGIRALLFGRLFLKARDQNAEVKGVHIESNLVLRFLQIVTRGSYLSRSDPVGLMNPDQLCQWLRKLCSAGEQRQLSLSDRETLRRDGSCS